MYNNLRLRDDSIINRDRIDMGKRISISARGCLILEIINIYYT